MKAKIRKTGEIVDVISFSNCSTIRNSLDYVSYIDSKGAEHDRESLNFYWDFEPIETTTNEHWQDVRERAAIAAMQGAITILGSSDRGAFRDIVAEGFRGDKKTYPNEIAEFAVACAKSLVEELKKK
jgi:hypothetical protein